MDKMLLHSVLLLIFCFYSNVVVPIKLNVAGGQPKENIENAYTKKSSQQKKQQKVLLVSIDGYRWDLRRIVKTRNIDTVIKNGVTVDHVLNVFPTKTMPNHHSIVTGLYPENHGIVDNAFLDRNTGLRFDMDDDECMQKGSWWNQSSPIWIDVQRKTKYESGSLFWPGNRAPYGSAKETPKYKPSETLKKLYKKRRIGGEFLDVFNELLVDQAVKWLSRDDVTFVSMYCEELDLTLHEHGVEHDLIETAMKLMDRVVGRIYKKIQNDDDLKESVNVIFIGDHGHVSTSFDRQIYINDFIDVKKDVEALYGFTDVFLYTKQHKRQRVYTALKEASDRDTRFKVFLTEDIPLHMHLRNSSRAPDILLLPTPGWVIMDKTNIPYYLKNREWTRSEHGYDNLDRDMNPGFFAFGPQFRKGFQKNCIETVDVYELMCHILGFEPSKNDGNFDRVKTLLKEFSHLKNNKKKNLANDNDTMICQ